MERQSARKLDRYTKESADEWTDGETNRQKEG